MRTAFYTAVFVLAIAMVITLIVFWNIYIINDYRTIKELYFSVHGAARKVPTTLRWTVLVLGITFFAVLIVVLSVFFANMLRGQRFKQQQRDFVNLVTHELRLPLSSIQVFAQTLRQRAMEPEARDRFADGILTESARLSVLVDQLLRLQQMEQGKFPIYPVRLEADKFLTGFAAKWPRPIQLRIESTAPLRADPLLLELALTNLLSNAEKYGRGKSPEILLTHAGNKVRFAVRDGGLPIPRRFIKKIFRKFYRMPGLATRRQTGVGLGLYIVKNIMTLHQGTVQVAPWFSAANSDHGNEFSLSLPAA